MTLSTILNNFNKGIIKLFWHEWYILVKLQKQCSKINCIKACQNLILFVSVKQSFYLANPSPSFKFRFFNVIDNFTLISPSLTINFNNYIKACFWKINELLQFKNT